MFSTKCAYCHTLMSLKSDELREVIAATEAAGQAHYAMPCPRCKRVNKIQLKELKRRLPPEKTDVGTESTPS